MLARIGPDDMTLLEHPRALLLQEISGIPPVAKGSHVLLDKHGIKSAQRLALADIGGRLVLGFWPGELKPQAEFVYAHGRAARMIEQARSLGWTVLPNPHIAFHNAAPGIRLYMAPLLDALDYAKRWGGPDGARIGQWAMDDVPKGLWTWLKSRGYADDADDPVMANFVRILGRRDAHLRPGMFFRREIGPTTARELGGAGAVAELLRGEVNAILDAGDGLRLPASRSVPR